MGKLISFLTVVIFSVSSFAQIEFGPLIEKSITPKENTAEELDQATRMANNIEGTDTAPETSVHPSGVTVTGKQPNSAGHTQQANHPTKKHEKDFTVKLHPTGKASAQRYFPKAPKVAKVAKAKKLTKKKTKNAKIAKNQKVKKQKSKTRTTASVTKKKKSTKTKKATNQSQASTKI